MPVGLNLCRSSRALALISLVTRAVRLTCSFVRRDFISTNEDTVSMKKRSMPVAKEILGYRLLWITTSSCRLGFSVVDSEWIISPVPIPVNGDVLCDSSSRMKASRICPRLVLWSNDFAASPSASSRFPILVKCACRIGVSYSRSLEFPPSEAASWFMPSPRALSDSVLRCPRGDRQALTDVPHCFMRAASP